MNKPVLTTDQAAAAESFLHFLTRKDTMFCLSGGPGTGKTFVMQHISKTVMNDYENICQLVGVDPEYTEMVFTATTNKAADVLEQSLGAPVQTIHSYLSLKVTENYKTGKTTLMKTTAWKVRRKMIVFIDEYSMIDSALLEIIKESFEDSKLVFIGDHSQMAPVNEKTSPVFDQIEPENFVFLQQPVRNANSPALINLCKQLRETVETGVFQPMLDAPGSIEHLGNDAMMQKLDEHFVQNSGDDARILCYTNSRVEHFNSYIREIRNLPEHMIVGDKMVTANTYTRGSSTLNVEREVEIQKIDNELHDVGYGELFQDQEPIRYRTAWLKMQYGGNPFSVNVPENKERWLLGIKEMSRRKNWSDYFELKNLCCDLRFKTACTVYKSQGSTYDTVFMDIGNIGTSYDAEQVARMLFVGASRAKNKVYLFGNLPRSYIGVSKPCLVA